MAVDADAATTVSAHATTDHHPVQAPSPEEEATLNRETIRTLAHRGGIGPLPHQELNGRQKGRLARARLAREHRKTTRGLQDRLADQGDVAYVQLVNHWRLPP